MRDTILWMHRSRFVGPAGEPIPDSCREPLEGVICTVCYLNHSRTVPATLVAREEVTLTCWFECGAHGPDEHPYYTRAFSMPIEEWRTKFNRHLAIERLAGES